MGRMKLSDDFQSVIEGKSFGGLKHTYNFPGNFLGYSGLFASDVIRKVQKHPDVGRLSVPPALNYFLTRLALKTMSLAHTAYNLTFLPVPFLRVFIKTRYLFMPCGTIQ